MKKKKKKVRTPMEVIMDKQWPCSLFISGMDLNYCLDILHLVYSTHIHIRCYIDACHSQQSKIQIMIHVMYE